MTAPAACVPSAGDVRPELPALGRLLVRVLMRASYDIAESGAFRMLGRAGMRRAVAIDIPAHYEQIDRALTLEAGEGGTLGELSCHSLGGISSLPHRMRRAGVDPERHEGYFVGVVSSIDGGRLIQSSRDRPDVVVDLHEAAVRRLVPDNGPQWVAARLRRQDGVMAPIEMFAQPCLSRGLLLALEHPSERAVAALLLDQLRYWDERHGLSIRLRRPLAAAPGEIRAQFVLEHGAKAIAVESDDPGRDFAFRGMRYAAAAGIQRRYVDFVWTSMEEDDDAVRRRLTAAVLRAFKPPGA